MRSFLYFIGSRFLSGEKGEKGDKGDQGEPGGTFSKSQMLEMFYPIGSYYETTDTTFDPNSEWTGVWVLEDEGLVHISSGTNYIVSANAQDGGEASHKLIAAEMPSHGHTVRLWGTAGASGVWKKWNGYGDTLINNDGGLRGGFSATWTTGSQTAAQAGNGDQAGRTDAHGGNQAHNNMQPYKIVNRWHRIA